MIYARAHDQTVAEDYYAAMGRVEERMEIVPIPQPKPEPKEIEVVKVPEPAQILTWIDLLALPELCQDERLEIAASLKQALSLNIPGELAPPLVLA